MREAIQPANTDTPFGGCTTGLGADIIEFAGFATLATILLAFGELTISSDIRINGLGANNLTVSGNGASRVFQITAGIVNINKLKFS